MDRWARLLVHVRFYVWWFVVVGAAVLWWISKPIAFDQSVEGFFPSDHPDLLNYQQTKRTFGNDDIVFVVYDDEQLWSAAGMSRLELLAQTLAEQVPGILRVESLSTMPVPWKVDAAIRSLTADSTMEQLLGVPKLIAGMTTMGQEVRAASERPGALGPLRARVCDHPLFRDVLVSNDGKTTAVVVSLNDSKDSDPTRSVSEIRRSADAFAQSQGISRVAVAGPPVLLADGFILLERDNRTLGLVAMALMGLTMLAATRGLAWAALPLLSGGAAWLITQQLLNMWQLKLTLAAGPIIAQSIILCMPAISHLAAHFQQAMAEHADDRQAAHHTLVTMAAPIAWCTLTATAGYLALLSSAVRPIIQFGLIMAGCNLIAGLLAYILSAAAMRRGHLIGMAVHAKRIVVQVSGMTSWAMAHPLRTMLLGVVPAIAIACGMGRLEFESNYIRIFKSRSRVASDYRFVEARMGGVGAVDLVVPAPKELTREWLQQLSATSARLAANNPNVVTKVLTLADVVGVTADEANAGPSNSVDVQRALAIKLRLLGSPAYAHFLRTFWNPDNGRMRVVVRIRESVDATAKQQAFERLAEQLRSDLGVANVQVTGLSQLLTQITRAIITTQFQSAAWSGAVILVMLWIALRSLRLAVIALLPTGIAIGLVLGVMGWLGIRIDLSTALVTSVALGLSVDDTFHCLLRWRRELRSGHTWREALRISFAGTGAGVILSSSAVSLGFLALVFSEFVPTANFGWLVAVATFGGSLGNLLILPACLVLLNSRTTGQNARIRSS